MGDLILALLLSLLTCYFAFKLKQNRGRLFLNDFFTSIGYGSFFVIVIGYIFDFIYLVLCIASGWGALFYFHKCGIIK